jgi:hypothetical protein
MLERMTTTAEMPHASAPAFVGAAMTLDEFLAGIAARAFRFARWACAIAKTPAMRCRTR